MTSGIIFYWFSWILWIIITFFMRKRKKRTILACWTLVSIFCADLYVEMDGFHLSVTLILFIYGSILLLVQQPRLTYHLFCSFTITVGYIAMMLWEINAPVWIVYSRLITISFLIGIVILILTKTLYSQLSICIFGASFGELIYHLILSSYNLHAVAGDFDFLDCILTVVFILVIVKLLKEAKSKLYVSLHSYKAGLKEPVHRLKLKKTSSIRSR